MELKKREEMDPLYQWNLAPIFASDSEWNTALAETEALVPAISSLSGTLGTSEGLKNALDMIASVSEKTELVYVYSFLRKSGDNGDPRSQEMQAKAMSLSVNLQTAASFFEPEILEIPENTYSEITGSDDFNKYRHMLDDIIRARPHTLDKEKEKILARLGDAAQGPSDTFEMLESVDMTFPSITDSEGKEIVLTHGNFSVYRESTDRRVRKEAYEKYFGEFKRYINTFAAMYTGSVKFDCFYSVTRNHKSACSAALFGSNVPVAVYDSLVEAVHSGLPTMRRYLELRKKVLGIEDLNMYDLYNPLLSSVDYEMPYANGKELVKKALAPLGDEYLKLLDKAYSESWIDVYENKGKTTGAYSCGVYGVHPYVLLNYTDTLDDAFTLAHELGHSMHSYYSSHEQEYINSDYKILVAEVASTVNEVLLTMYLLKTETDTSRRAYILNHFLEGFRTTVFRQTLFAEFERTAHDMYQSGTPLTAQSLNQIYRKLNELYYDGAVINELQDIEWARIPHFYRAFYVYQYATGFCSAVSIAKNILDLNDAGNYLEFLKTGGSDYPINELKIAGIDLTKPDTVLTALKVFDDTVTELVNLIG